MNAKYKTPAQRWTDDCPFAYEDIWQKVFKKGKIIANCVMF